MASYTTNLNLKKPAGSENVAIGDINNNMDTIDQAFGTLNSNITNMFGGIRWFSFARSSSEQNDKPWLVLKEQFDNITDGCVCIGVIECAGKRSFWGYRSGNYGAFVVQMYSNQVPMYRVINNNGNWRYAEIETGNYTVFE